jgi:hypothetical protein
VLSPGHAAVHLFIFSSIHLFIHSFIHLFIFSFIHSVIFSFIHSFFHSFIHSFIYSSFHSGVLCPWVEASGAATGAVTSFATLLFIKIGAIRAQYKPPTLPASILGCAEVPPTNVTDFSTPSSNVTYHTTPYTNATSFATRSTITTYSTAPPHVTSAPHVFALYRVSFFWYALIAVVVSTCVASFVSLGLRLFKVDSRMIHSDPKFVNCRINSN